jgi:hypothetical protein
VNPSNTALGPHKAVFHVITFVLSQSMLSENNIPPAWDHKLHQNLIHHLIVHQGTAALLRRKPECTATSREDCSVQNSNTKRLFMYCRSLHRSKFWVSDPTEQQLCHFNPLNAQLNPICHLLALLAAHPILHVSRIRVNACTVHLYIVLLHPTNVQIYITITCIYIMSKHVAVNII